MIIFSYFFAGYPTTVEFYRTSCTTTEPAPTRELVPIVTSSTIDTLGSIYTLSHITAGVS